MYRFIFKVWSYTYILVKVQVGHYSYTFRVQPELPKEPWENRTKLEVSHFLFQTILQCCSNQNIIVLAQKVLCKTSEI